MSALLPLLALFTVSVRQALPRRRALLLGLLQLAPAAVFAAASINRTQEFAFESVIQVGGSIYFALVLPVVAIVVATGVLGSERRDQTLSFIALRPLPRSAIAVAKVLAAITAAFLLNAIGAVALAGTYAFRFGDPQLFVGLLFGALIATVAYSAVLVPIGFLTDRAVIVAMAYLLIFENGVIFALPGLISLSPWRLGISAFASLTPDAVIHTSDFIERFEFSTPHSILTAAAYFAIGVVATTILLRSKDLA